MNSQTQVLDWQFDLTSPVYLLHPNYKFWELKLAGKTLTFRVGKLRDGEESNIEETSKAYSSNTVARTTALTKIEEKLTKGYTPKDGKKV